jgi:type II secretion system protein N
MPETKKRRLQLALGYLAFGLFSLVAGFFLTFPYDTLKERVRLEADQAGYFLRIASLGPGLLAVRASDVQVSKKADTEPPPEALSVDSLSFGPSLVPPGISLKVRALGGSVTATLSGLSDTRVQVDAQGLDLSKGNVKGFSGIDFSGTVNAQLDLSIPRVATAGGPAEPDLSQASGAFAMGTKELAINGGNVSIVIPQYGPEPTPLDLPKIILGDLVAKVKFDKGAATVEEFRAKGPDLEATISGTMKLGKRLEYSEPNLEVRFKPDPEFQKRLGLIGSALSMIGADPKDPSWRLGRLTGFLGRPQFR